jgi:hypothetical protein
LSVPDTTWWNTEFFSFAKANNGHTAQTKKKQKKATCPRLHHAGPSQTEARHKPAIRIQAFVAIARAT